MKSDRMLGIAIVLAMLIALALIGYAAYTGGLK